tara:strand:- start:2568 stop:3350 length:783 start_codon:yes stop_codon:yes gene_type:complete
MIFTPFAFMAETGPTWTPASFTDVKYWWTADSGVTESGGAVSSWVDQIASFDMQQPTGANQPSITTSATLNGENVISFNGTTDYLWTTTAPSSQPTNADLTMLSVINLINTRTGGVFMGAVLVGVGTRAWLDTLSGNLRFFNQNYPTFNGGNSNIESPATTGAKALKWRYDSSAGDSFYAIDTLTESALVSGTETGTDSWNANTTIGIGATLNNNGGSVFGGRYVQVEVAEQVWIENTPTPTEMTDWQTYVNNKYGTIIT